MTNILVEYKNKEALIEVVGHTGYANSGEDIVCAGVSALVINTINSIEAFTEDVFADDVQKQEEDVVFFAISSIPVSEKSKLLLDSLILGLKGIEEDYGKQFIKLTLAD